MNPAPLTLAEVAPILERLVAEDRGLVAVSGGADSMALMHLVADWYDARPRSTPRPTVATVDHGLRAEAADEARFVAAEALNRGLTHATLRWLGDKPNTGVQAAARQARYDLLQAHARTIGAAVILTAHTADDQAETLLMRLARGSGVEGLAAMRAQRRLDDATLARPLLGVPKSRLVAMMAARGLSWREDPSNEMTAFERVRLRSAAPALAHLGLTTAPLARSAVRLARAADALNVMTGLAVEQGRGRIAIDPLGFARLDWAWLLSLPEEIRLRLLSHLIKAVGGRHELPSLGRLEAMTVGRGWRAPVGCALGRAVFAGGGLLTVTREVGRDEAPCVAIAPGQGLTWDGRFDLWLMDAAPEGLTVAALGPDGLAAAETRGLRRRPAPARALWSTPAIWRGTELVAAPLLGVYAGEATADWFMCGFACAWPFAAE